MQLLIIIFFIQKNFNVVIIKKISFDLSKSYSLASYSNHSKIIEIMKIKLVVFFKSV